MAFAQTNYIIQDDGKNYIEAIYLTGNAVAHSAQTNQNFTLARGGKLKALSATIINLSNTNSIVIRVLTTGGAQPTYGMNLVASTGLQLQIGNIDAAVDETNVCVLVILYGN